MLIWSMRSYRGNSVNEVACQKEVLTLFELPMGNVAMLVVLWSVA